MRIFSSILMVFVLAFFTTACSSQKEESSASSYAPVYSTPEVDTNSYAAKGEFDEVPIKLGDSRARVEAEYGGQDESDTSDESAEDSADQTGVFLMESEAKDGKVITLRTNNLVFCYLADAENDNITMMVTFEGAYGLICGVSDENDIISALGEPADKAAPTEDEMFFIPGGGVSGDTVRYQYVYGQYRLDLYVINQTLSVISLCDADMWK